MSGHAVQERAADTDSLLVMQSLWAMERRHPDGFESSLDQNVARILDGGFDGISGHCVDPVKVRLIAKAIAGTGLAMEGMCFPRTVDDLKPSLECATGIGVTHLSVQPDVRLRRIDDCIPLVEGWMRLAEEVDFPIYFETHRNRMTTDLFFTLDLIERIPSMPILADLSHILVGREFWYPLSSEDEALVFQVLDLTWAFHGRVASREQVQVEISFPQHQVWLDLFLRWWEYGFRSWRQRAKAGTQLSFTCELGPRPYAITDKEDNDTTDRWTEALLLKSRVRELWRRIVDDERHGTLQIPA
jgi:hypothetical protein